MKTILLSVIILVMVTCPASADPGDTKTGKDPAVEQEMVQIPAGEFTMGTKPGRGAKYVDNPQHKVKLDGFYMDRYEVTNSMYIKFCKETGNPYPEFWGMDAFCSGPDFPDHPVVGVTWADASKYAAWAGKRLPTEAEWEYAARGGLIGKRYPNGNDVDSTQSNYKDAYGHAIPVGSLPPNGYGLYDMSGNATEWVNDFYAKDYYLESPHENPEGPEIGKRRVIRGGGWRSGKMCATCNFRQSLRPYWVDINVGFRCAKDLE
jgi:formylglycine-generating enzyme required for sulfatase activity